MERKSRGYQEAEAAIEFLRGRGVERLVHFTSVDNVASILRHGLAPRSELDSRGIGYQGNDDLRLDGSGHVNLSVTHPNPGFFYRVRKEHPERLYVVLSIKLEALLLFTGDGGAGKCAFMSTNAAASAARRCNVEQLFAGQRPEGYRDGWTTDPQAEVLVPGTIPPQLVDEVVVPSDYQSKAPGIVGLLAPEVERAGLDCRLRVCDEMFDSIRRRIASASLGERYEYYFISWQTGRVEVPEEGKRSCWIVSCELVEGNYGPYYEFLVTDAEGEMHRVHCRPDEYRDVVGPYIDSEGTIAVGPWICYRRIRVDESGRAVWRNNRLIRDLVFRPAEERRGESGCIEKEESSKEECGVVGKCQGSLYCVKCGETVQSEWSYCLWCGTEVPGMLCPECGSRILKAWGECHKCDWVMPGEGRQKESPASSNPLLAAPVSSVYDDDIPF